MKKIILVIGLLAMIPAFAVAQPNNLNVENDQSANDRVYKKAEVNVIARMKAERNFTRTHKQVGNIRWYEDPGGFFVYYNCDGKKGRSFYSHKGKFIYDLISYPEEFLSYRLKDLVKSVYYMNYRITHVSEMHVPGRVVYFIQLTDDKTWKKVKIQDGEMELISDYTAS